MSVRVRWQASRRQNLARLARASGARDTAIGRALFQAQCNRVLTSRSIAAATIADLVGADLPDDVIWNEAEAVDMFGPCRQPLRWFLRPKRSGGFRTICLPDLRMKVRQRIISNMIVAQQSPHPQIFNWKGRGCSRQANQIKTALEAGNRHVVIGDVRDCFPSVNFDAVFHLNLLPTEVLRLASDARQLDFVHVPDPQVIEHSIDTAYIRSLGVQPGPRGLLQGLGSSDALWASLISDLPERLSAFGVPFIYCDNIAVACSIEKAAAEAKETLVRYFSDHRAGPFSLNVEVHDAYVGFEHTGYTFSAYAIDDRVVASIMPSLANACTLFRRLVREVRTAGRTGLSRDEALKVFNQRLSPFSAVTDDYRDELFSSFIAELEG